MTTDETALTPELSERFAAAGLDAAQVEGLVLAALAEDLAGGVDVTSAATVPSLQHSVGDFVARGAGVVAGLDVAQVVVEVVTDGRGHFQPGIRDGDRVEPGTLLASAEGRTRDLLTGERTALNLLCHLSGIATATRAWVDVIAGTGAVVRDTRKTTPLLRSLEKYAVRCGGGTNHRMALSDAALVKDNHVVAAGGVASAFAAVRAMWPDLPVEVEVDSLKQLEEVLAEGADLVLLDNMSVEDMREAVRLTAGRARLEASGGLTLATARAVAETGVDFIAVGALTHSAPVLDIALDLRPVDEGDR
jgi:nicotinate-nucleotide pyrophosphorylase (carboxylating)